MDLDTLVNSLKSPGTRILDAVKTESGFEVHGENRWQEFIEFYSADGTFLGMLLRLKEELFWQIWNKDRQVVTKRINKRKTRTLGSNNQQDARKMLKELIQGAMCRLPVSCSQAEHDLR